MMEGEREGEGMSLVGGRGIPALGTVSSTICGKGRSSWPHCGQGGEAMGSVAGGASADQISGSPSKLPTLDFIYPEGNRNLESVSSITTGNLLRRYLNNFFF